MTNTRNNGNHLVTEGTNQLWTLFEQRVQASPNELAVDDESERSHTWAELARAIEAASCGLADLGITAGSTVSWQLHTSIDALVLSLALCRSGVIQNPIIPGYGVPELQSVLKQVKPSVMFTEQIEDLQTNSNQSQAVIQPDANLSVATSLSDLVPQLATVASLTSAIDMAAASAPPRPLPPPPSPITGGQAAWYCFTSGSTAFPKGAIHADQAVLTAGLTIATTLKLTAEDRYAVIFPFAHIGGISNVVSSLISGMPLTLFRKFDPGVTIPAMRDLGLTVAGAGPPFFSAYIEAQRHMPDGEAVFPKVRTYVGGGAPTPPQIHEAFLSGPQPAPISIGYGLTESPMVTMTSPSDSLQVRSETVGRPRSGSIVRIADTDGNELGIGVEGEVLVKGPQLLLGYLDESLNESAFVDGWFRTGDLGTMDADGNLSIVGRIKDIIIRNMENIAPSEVEDLLMHHPAISQVAVIGLPDARTGERVCAVIVAHDEVPPSDSDLSVAKLGEWAATNGLARPKIPTQIELVSSLPLIGVGKADKEALKTHFSQ